MTPLRLRYPKARRISPTLKEVPCSTDEWPHFNSGTLWHEGMAPIQFRYPVARRNGPTFTTHSLDHLTQDGVDSRHTYVIHYQTFIPIYYYIGFNAVNLSVACWVPASPGTSTTGSRDAWTPPSRSGFPSPSSGCGCSTTATTCWSSRESLWRRAATSSATTAWSSSTGSTSTRGSTGGWRRGSPTTSAWLRAGGGLSSYSSRPIVML